MNPRNLLLLLLLWLPVPASRLAALDYLVYKVSGKAVRKTASGETALRPGDKLAASAAITIPYGSQVQLVNTESRERHTLKTPGSGPVSAMLADTRNSVSKVARQYFDYMLAQVASGGKSVQVRHADFATVTREQYATARPDSAAASDDIFSEFDAEFSRMQENIGREYEDFMAEVNAEYAEFLKRGWQNFDVEAPQPRPKDEDVQPLVTTSAPAPATNSFFSVFKRIFQPAPPPVQPTPVASIPEQEDIDETPVHIRRWGTDFVARFDTQKGRFRLRDLSPSSISDAWKTLSSRRYNNLVRDCIDLRFEKHLGDWAYLQVLRDISQACLGPTNEATLLMAYIYCQSGYRMRLAQDGGHLFMLFASEHYIYEQPYVNMGNTFFYPFDYQPSRIQACNQAFPGEESMSLYISEQQQFDYDPTSLRTVKSVRYPDITLTFNVNSHLIDFYDKYPTSTIDNDMMTRWAMYANTPMDEQVQQQLYPVLRQKLAGLSKLDAVERLLNWVQTGFEYRFDEECWGHDRAFFAEETLFYPYCDCEDRAILLSRLVRDLLGLKCVLVYYPGHLAMAVHFGTPDVSGTYYELNGERYFICDPTITGWGAPVGTCMPAYATCTDVGLILLENTPES